ncbi:MAG: hypothetical protein RQ966_15945 [Acetobacteraceae bacterium]|nr:hypothetical protein [Acetobacteraceae bacterium]
MDRARTAAAHVVPLAPEAVACLDAIHPLTGASEFVFPAAISMRRHVSEATLGTALQRIGYKGRHVPHDWRATFSSVMNEMFPADRQVIDLMLAHVPKDRVEGAYNRARHMAAAGTGGGVGRDVARRRDPGAGVGYGETEGVGRGGSADMDCILCDLCGPCSRFARTARL